MNLFLLLFSLLDLVQYSACFHLSIRHRCTHIKEGTCNFVLPNSSWHSNTSFCSFSTCAALARHYTSHFSCAVYNDFRGLPLHISLRTSFCLSLTKDLATSISLRWASASCSHTASSKCHTCFGTCMQRRSTLFAFSSFFRLSSRTASSSCNQDIANKNSQRPVSRMDKSQIIKQQHPRRIPPSCF